MARGPVGDLLRAAEERPLQQQACGAKAAACRFPSVPWAGSSLAFGVATSPAVSAAWCGGAAGRAEDEWHPPEPPCWVQGFSWLHAWRGLCSAPRPEAVELWRWLIKAGCLGRPICSQVNCAAIFPFGRRTKTSRQFVQRMDGRSHVPVHIPPLAFPEPQRPTRSHAERAMCWYKRQGNTLPAAACWTPAKHPLLLLRFWQLCVLCLLWCLLRRQLCGHLLTITLSPICRRSLLILRLVLHWRGNVMVCECYSERCVSQVFTHSLLLPPEQCVWLISLHPGVQRATLSNISEPRHWGTIEAGEQLAPNLQRLPKA